MVKKEEVKASVVKQEDSSDDNADQLDEEEQKWWVQENIQFATKGEKRWDTLSHNGVMFPPKYVPHGIPIIYDGRELKLTPEEEEVATMFAVMKEHDYYRNEIFRQNFFRSWREILDKREHPIRRLELCEFERIYQWHLREREKRLNRTKEEKKKLKELTDKEAEPYRYCLWDGKQEQVANYRVEPPGLFRGRGQHPMMGTLKRRVYPEDITINIGKEAEVPAPPPGHRWGAVQHDNTVTWLAMWHDTVLGNLKYVMLAPSSAVKGQSDMMKFEKARQLKGHVDRIRESYTNDFRSRDTHVAQRAVAMYFIDKLALRVGNEKSSDEADTVGCCSLRVEHIALKPDNVVKFDFLGKDSIRYENEVTILPEVYHLLTRFIRGKHRDDNIFDQLSPTQLNDHLKSFMSGLSAKVFRTFNASITLDRWFREKPVNPKASISDKLAYFNKANAEVAILCNHQKSVSKNFRAQMSQLVAKSDYTRGIIRQLEQALATMKAKSVEAAAKEFFEEQDRIQYDWLDKYGTPEQKEEYAKLVEQRGMPKVRSSSATKKPRSSNGMKKNGTTKKSSRSASKTKKKKITTKSKPSAKRVRKEESSDDEAIASLSKKSAPRSKGTRGRKTVKVEVSDDDVPLSSL